MILPNKAVKPVDSLYCISSYVVEELGKGESHLDDLHEALNSTYPKEVNFETLLLCLDFLYIMGKLEVSNEIVKAKL